MAMVPSASSGLAYPERFYAAASYAGFGGSPKSPSKAAISKFSNDDAFLLYGLYQQATVGPCTIPKPRAWNPVEYSKWASWNGLENLSSTTAMRIFVYILENPQVEDGTSYPVPKTTFAENGSPETEDKDVIMEGLGSIDIYDQWIAPAVSGQCPRPRYEHGAAIIQDKMYIFGGNNKGRYLNDLQVLDLKTLTWSKVDVKVATGSLESSSPVSIDSMCWSFFDIMGK